MLRYIPLLIILALLTLSCKTERPEEQTSPSAQTSADTQTTGNRTNQPDDMEIGIDVDIETALKNLKGKWKLIKVSPKFKKFELGLPGDISFSDDNTYVFNINLLGKGKLSYKGKWELKLEHKRLVVYLSRTHRAFEGDWKEAEATETAIIRFLDNKYKKAIINVFNTSWHRPVINADFNNEWERQ